MDWVLRSPQIHSTFSNLGFVQSDGYHVNENCNSALETILNNILSEDKYLRTYRRSISFGQNITKDIIPLLIHAKDVKTIELVIRILVNLTVPMECLLNVPVISHTDYGRYAMFEINNLLASAKIAFTDFQTSKALVDFLKKNMDVEHKEKLSEEQCINVSNCLVLLRNILQIPEGDVRMIPNYKGSAHSIQNQILWNIFSQSVDKLIIKSITILDASFWGVTMVQLVALLYKDQHVFTLHKLLNNWLEASVSESSEDNESNTSPPNRGSEDSSPMPTSEQTDSSDNGVGDKCGDSTSSEHTGSCADADSSVAWKPDTDLAATDDKLDHTLNPNEHENMDDDKFTTTFHPDEQVNTADNKLPNTKDDKTNSIIDISPRNLAEPSVLDIQNKNHKPTVISEASDCGYGTHIDNIESVSTSSNEDELPTKNVVHQKPHNAKQKPHNKPRLGGTTQDRKRKKIVKRGKANIINVQGLSHKTPTDDDISNMLKEFTVDFLLKGYNTLVQTLHKQVLANPQLHIDTSHFFWLVTYFLKFATQIELNLEYVDSVLSFEIISYLTSEGVNLCEQFELAIKLDGTDLSPYIRKQHLVVTSIREFVQAIEVYKKIPHLDEYSRETLKKLQIKMCETEELRSMLVLLLRHFNPKYHSKQYLKDLVVTNHILLIYLDDAMKLPEYNCSTKMLDHIGQFATVEIMAQYGLLLSDYHTNGEYVNDCIFTLMHHVGGEAGSLITLFQPHILKIFISLWKSDFEICDDWSDLIEYVINTFVTKTNTLGHTDLLPEVDGLIENKMKTIEIMSSLSKQIHDDVTIVDNTTEIALEKWTDEEISALSWNYLQNNTHPDVIGKITKQLQEDGIVKTRESVTRELFKQHLISREFCEKQLKEKCCMSTNTVQLNKKKREDEIAKFCEHLILDGESVHLVWVQKVLLEICHVKIYLQKRNRNITNAAESVSKLLSFELFKKKNEDLTVVSPVVYHSLISQRSVPLVPWNCPQARICKNQKFLQLLHKLGFQMPVDTGKVFIRIPHFWTPDFLFDVAGKLRPIDTSKLKFSESDLSYNDLKTTKQENTVLASTSVEDVPLLGTMDSIYQIHKQSLATMVNFTPRPCPPFKSEAEAEQLNWLQIVKKSQEHKIVLNLESIAETTESIVNQLPEEDHGVSVGQETQVFVAPLPPPAPLPLPLPVPELVPVLAPAPAPVTVTVPVPAEPVICEALFAACTDHETWAETVLLADLDHYSSTFETASVASDLTRMYVSDEDEKLEIIVRPSLNPKISTNKEQTSPEMGKTCKRRREK